MAGIGAGNAARLFRALIPDEKIIPIWVEKGAISLHNAWMEICVEFGLAGITLCILIIINVLKILRQKRWSKFQIVAIAVGLSVWVWIIF